MTVRKPLNVLIVESSQDIAASIHDYLLSLGYTVDTVDNEAKGLQFAVSKAYDIVILDLNPPFMDGAELCRQIRRDNTRYVPVLLLMAGNSLESKLEGFNSGADDCMTKPFSLKELAARIKSLTKHINRIPTLQQLVDDSLLHENAHKPYHTKKHNNFSIILLQLISYLIQNPNRIIKREEFEYAVWKMQSLDMANRQRTYIASLHEIVDYLLDRFSTKHESLHQSGNMRDD